MAISKERLKELIEQGATIYKISDSMATDYQLCSYNYLDDNDLIYENCLSTYWRCCIGKLDDLFETKEDAEFALRYKRIPKTEYLDLPTFEEITTNDKYNYYGTSYFEFGDGYRLIVKLPSEDDDCEFIGIDVNGNCELHHWEEATKENYLEACELCRKLWLGEEV